MAKYQSKKNVNAEFRFDSRADYVQARFLAYNLRIRALPRLECTDEDGTTKTRMFITGPEYRIWTFMEDLDCLGIYYVSDFGLLVE